MWAEASSQHSVLEALCWWKTRRKSLPGRNPPLPKAKKTLPKAEPAKEKQQKGQDGKRDGKRDGKQEKPEVQSLNGKEYLQSKAIAPTDIEEDIDENMEARIVRLEMTIQKLEARIARLEAENNLRKNEKLMERQAKQQKKAQQPTNLGDLQIL